MSTLDWLIVLLLNGSIIGYGFYLARGTETSSEWFLGARALPWWGIGLSMFATNLDNADLVSVTGNTYTQGLHIITVYAIGSSFGGILAAFIIVPAIYRAGFYTNAEYLEGRFGPSVRILSALIQLQYRSSMLGMMIWTVSIMLEKMVGLEAQPKWALILAMVIFSGLYTAWGGLKSVVWTDALQGVVMMIGGGVIYFAVWKAVGGWSGMLEVLQTAGPEGENLNHMTHIGQYHGKSGALNPLVIVMGWTIVGSGYWTVNHTQTMRLMGARSLWDMKMAAVFGVALSLPIMVICASLGIFGRALLPDLAAVEGIAAPDELYPYLANQYLTTGLKGLVVAGVVAAAVSTFDSMGSALSAIFTRDIYARFLSSEGDDKHYVMVSRCATVGVLALGFLYLPFIAYQKNMLDAFTTLIPVFVTPLFTIYVLGVTTRIHRHGGIAGIVVGGLYGVFALYAREAPSISWLPNLDFLPFWLSEKWAAFGWSLLFTALAMGITTLIFGLHPKDASAMFEEKGWLQRSREALPSLKEHPFADKTPWWANPEFFAAVLVIWTVYIVFVLYW